jgi:hypothetical protein
MARGHSGRVVLEIDPSLKRALHGRLATEGRTMKDWFIENAERYLRQAEQLPLRLDGGPHDEGKLGG